MSTHLPLVAAVFCSLILGACQASRSTSMTPNTATGVLFRTATVGAEQRRFAIYVPREYTPSKPWPCVVFLNGRGECGTDGTRQLAVGLLPAILADPERWPVIAIFPQKPEQESQWADHDTLVMACLDLARLEFNVDSSRIFLTGLSQGGGGTWSIGASHPDLWAALAPVCGYGDPANIAPRLIDTPVWAFHGLKDDVVKPEQTIDMVGAIKAAQAKVGKGPEPLVTLFPDANHNAWDPTYRGQDLPPWFMNQRRAR